MLARNMLCHCGSGRKYKKCCQPGDDREHRTARRMGTSADARKIPPALLATLDRNVEWQVDTTPFPGAIEGAPASRLVSVLVGTQGTMLYAQPEESPSAEPPDVALLLAGAVRDAIDAVGFTPPEIVVRHSDVAASLRQLFGAAPIVSVKSNLQWTDDVAKFLRHKAAGGGKIPPPIATPHAWAAWGLPREMVERLFRAAAIFFRGAPWDGPAAAYTFGLRCGNGSEWEALVFGGAGGDFGLSLFEHISDRENFAAASGPDEAFAAVSGMMVMLLLQARNEIPRDMQREISRAGWEVAGPEAYPTLVLMNTPGAGISVRIAGELADALEAIGRWGERTRPMTTGALATASPWNDAASGTTIKFVPATNRGKVPHDTSDDVSTGLPPGVAALWIPPARLVPCGPLGPRAMPGAWLMEDDRGCLDEGDEFLDAFVLQVKNSRATDEMKERTTVAAAFFVDFLTDIHGVPVHAVTELDLRIFLYDWLPRMLLGSRADIMAMRSALRRFFRFLAERAGIECPWAGAILLDRTAFELRWESLPGMHSLDPAEAGWRRVLSHDLALRVLIPSHELGNDLLWDPSRGPDEARLHLELTRRSLGWRDEAIAGGTDYPQAVRAYCLAHQQAWESDPHDDFGGASPLEVVRRERRILRTPA